MADVAGSSKERLFKSLDGMSKGEHLRNLAGEMRISAGILNECASLFDDLDAFLGSLAECFDEKEEEFADIRDMRGRIRGELVAPSRPALEPETDEGWRALFQRTVSGPAGLAAQLQAERDRRIAAENALARASQPPFDALAELREIEDALLCRGGAGHHCSNCDNSTYELALKVRALIERYSGATKSGE
jgi:hypothetical protein